MNHFFIPGHNFNPYPAYPLSQMKQPDFGTKTTQEHKQARGADGKSHDWWENGQERYIDLALVETMQPVPKGHRDARDILE